MNLEPPKDLLDKQKRGAAAYAPGEKPKTKVGALMRSLVIPGFGQIYSGKKGSGFTILLLEAGLIGMAAKSNNDYLAFQTEWNTQLVNYQSATRSEEHTSELQSQAYLVCRLLLEKKKKHQYQVSGDPHR